MLTFSAIPKTRIKLPVNLKFTSTVGILGSIVWFSYCIELQLKSPITSRIAGINRNTPIMTMHYDQNDRNTV